MNLRLTPAASLDKSERLFRTAQPLTLNNYKSTLRSGGMGECSWHSAGRERLFRTYGYPFHGVTLYSTTTDQLFFCRVGIWTSTRSHVCTSARMRVCTYVSLHGRTCMNLHVRLRVCAAARAHICTAVRLHICKPENLQVCGCAQKLTFTVLTALGRARESGISHATNMQQSCNKHATIHATITCNNSNSCKK